MPNPLASTVTDDFEDGVVTGWTESVAGATESGGALHLLPDAEDERYVEPTADVDFDWTYLHFDTLAAGTHLALAVSGGGQTFACTLNADEPGILRVYAPSADPPRAQDPYVAPGAFDGWLGFKRSGDTVTIATSPDGSTWTPVMAAALTLPVSWSSARLQADGWRDGGTAAVDLLDWNTNGDGDALPTEADGFGTPYVPTPPPGCLFQVLSAVVTFAGVALDYVFEASGSAGWDTPYPTCSVLVPTKPATGNEGDVLSVVAGAQPEIAQAFTATASTDVLTDTGHGFADGDAVVLFGDAGTFPGGLTQGRRYYVRDGTANTFKVAATVGGGAVDISADGVGTASAYGKLRGTFTATRFHATDNPPTVEIRGFGFLKRAEQLLNQTEDDLELDELLGALPFTANAGSDVVTATGHPWSDGQQVVVLPNKGGMTLPGGLAERTIYYVRDSATDTFKLAASSGGSAIDITSAGTGTFTVMVASTGKNIILTHLAATAAAFPEVTYDADNLDDTGVLLGLEQDAPFRFPVGQSRLDHIREIDRLEGMRTFQIVSGDIYRRRIYGYPQDTAADFTFDETNSLPGTWGDRNTEDTRNACRATGFDDGSGAVVFQTPAYDLTGILDADYPAVHEVNHPMIEREDEATDPGDGYSAQQVAERELDTVLKEFAESSVVTHTDDLYGPSQTHLVDLLTRIRVGENMLCSRVDWRISAGDGWTQTLHGLGGGITADYDPIPV